MASAEVNNNEGEAGADAVVKIPPPFGDATADAAEVITANEEGTSETLSPETEPVGSKAGEITPNVDEAVEVAHSPANQSGEAESRSGPTESPSPMAATDIGGAEQPSVKHSDDTQPQDRPLEALSGAADPVDADYNSTSEAVAKREPIATGNSDSPALTTTQGILPTKQGAELETVKDEVQSPEPGEAATSAASEDQANGPLVEIGPTDSESPAGHPAPTETSTEEQAIEVANAEPPAYENTGSEKPAEVELTTQPSADPLPAKPPSFLDSLTADFTPDTKAMWVQIFGPRYEEGDEDRDLQPDNQSIADSTAASVSSRTSLKAKLVRERKLDEQIQASQRRYRERVLRNAAANNAATKRGRVKASRRPQTQIPTLSPFELAGLSLTQVRFCTEKALDETCKCFRNLHAVALEEVEEPVNPVAQGVYITQGELEILLQELFDPQEPTTSDSNNRRGTVIGPLGFANAYGAGFDEEIPLSTQLQASWFIPFGQLPQLRSLVMKITKRHLNEDKLAIVNRHLQKQLTLLPLSAKLQDLVIQLSNYQMKEPPDVPLRQRLRSSVDLAQDLLGCISVNGVMTTERQTEDYQNFLLFLPVDLVAKTHLSSVVCAQRLVFFRFLIDIMAAERSRVHPQSTESLPPAMTNRTSSSTQPRRKTISKRGRSSSKLTTRDSGSDDIPEACDIPSDNPAAADEVTSIHAAHGSVPSASEAGVGETPGGSDPFEQPIEQAGAARQLQQQLETAITQLRQALPAIDSELDQDAKIYAVNPAIRTTYLAAAACQQSVHILLENNIDVDSTVSDKLKHFIDALKTIQVQTGDPVYTTPASPPQENEPVDHPPQNAPKFPPPYPESTVSQENDDQSEISAVQAQFPPPYAVTTPSYWTFAPSIPEPKSSIAKLASKSPSNKSADLRSHFMSKDSPGVGAYNIQRAEKLTFEQRPSYSFGSTGETLNTVHGDTRVDSNASISHGSVQKPSSRPTLRQRMKSSLAFAPPPLRPPPEETSEGDQESIRVHAASQYDDNHLETSSNDDLLNDLPPHYGAGDANDAPDERSDGDQVQDLSVETEMDRALRLQQRIFMDEFVQQVVSNQDSPSHFVPRVKSSTTGNERTRSKSKPYWATSEVSPGIEKLLQRQRRAPSASKARTPSTSTAPTSKPVHQPRAPRTAHRIAKKGPPSPPPRSQLDNDQHLAWAARISELYQPT